MKNCKQKMNKKKKPANLSFFIGSPGPIRSWYSQRLVRLMADDIYEFFYGNFGIAVRQSNPTLPINPVKARVIVNLFVFCFFFCFRQRPCITVGRQPRRADGGGCGHISIEYFFYYYITFTFCYCFLSLSCSSIIKNYVRRVKIHG